MKKPVIKWGISLFDVDTGKNIDYQVTHLSANVFDNMLKLTVERGREVHTIEITMEHATRIGLINFDLLVNYMHL